jgi:phospholipid/cholesterol/gamma-HCH transport system substrate-binding protein
MARRLNNALVGLFVIVLGLIWLGISLWLALGDYSVQYTTYRVYIDESVSGLYLDAPVKYRGVEVGKVTHIELNPEVPDQVQLTLDVVSNTPIRIDTVAELSVQGLTGIAFVDLKGGSLDAPLLEAAKDQEYPVINSAPSFFARLDTSGTELVANVNVVANRLGRLLDAESGESIKGLLANLNTLSGTLAQRSAEIDQAVLDSARMLENGAAASAQLSRLLEQATTTAAAFENMANRVAAASDSLERYVAGSGSGVQQFSQQTLPELGSLVSELRVLADSLRAVSEKLAEDPRVLLYGNQLDAPGPGE